MADARASDGSAPACSVPPMECGCASSELGCRMASAADIGDWGPGVAGTPVLVRISGSGGEKSRMMEPNKTYKRERLVPRPSRVSSLTSESPSGVNE